MKYIVKVNDKEYGPVTDDILRKWVEDGRVLSNTQVRNSMIMAWKKAEEFLFLKTAFEKQRKKFNTSINTSASHVDKVTKMIRKPLIGEGKKDQNKSSEFKNRLFPDRAGISLRFKAGIIDLAVIVLFFIVSFLLCTYSVSYHRADPNFAVYVFFMLWLFLILLYFGGSIGVVAQTLGMWYYGIILVRNGDDTKEVHLLRAYIYALLIFAIGIFSPVFNFIGRRKRSLHDFLTDTQVIRISARKTK